MSAAAPGKQNFIVAALSAVATGLMIAAFFAPIWRVSLTAPNYPADAFPDGIRIHLHFDAVYNGCKAAGKGTRMDSEIIHKELAHDDERYNPITDKNRDVNKGAEGLDCVHEMNTINHYVGMFPIATGAPVEKPLAKFFFAFFTVMLVGVMVPLRKPRLLVLAAGFAAVAGWIIVDQYVMGGLEGHGAYAELGIGANLLFTFSFWLDIQILEGALTALRFVGFHLIDLHSALRVMLAHKHIIVNLFIGTATVFVLWALLGGRSFCSWIRPYPLLAEWFEWLHLKLVSKKLVSEHEFHRGMRTVFWVIFALLAAVGGYTVFETISPTGILSRALIYGPSLALGWVLLLLVFEVVYSRRAWCRYVSLPDRADLWYRGRHFAAARRVSAGQVLSRR